MNPHHSKPIPLANRIVFTLLLMLMGTMQLQAASDMPVWTGPSFRAIQTEYNEKTQQQTSRLKVFMSKYGVKLVSVAVGGPQGSEGMSSIVLAKNNQSYLIFPDLKLYIDPTSEEGAIEKDDSVTGIFATKPCENFKHAVSLGQVMLKNRPAEKWRCSNQQGMGDVIHYMDKDLKCVVRSETGDGTITELSEITLDNFPKEFFDLPKGYRKGTMRDLLQNQHALPAYDKETPVAELPK